MGHLCCPTVLPVAEEGGRGRLPSPPPQPLGFLRHMKLLCPLLSMAMACRVPASLTHLPWRQGLRGLVLPQGRGRATSSVLPTRLLAAAVHQPHRKTQLRPANCPHAGKLAATLPSPCTARSGRGEPGWPSTAEWTTHSSPAPLSGPHSSRARALAPNCPRFPHPEAGTTLRENLGLTDSHGPRGKDEARQQQVW